MKNVVIVAIFYILYATDDDNNNDENTKYPFRPIDWITTRNQINSDGERGQDSHCLSILGRIQWVFCRSCPQKIRVHIFQSLPTVEPYQMNVLISGWLSG